MTEYDYSPEAYEQHLAKQARIARWVDNTHECTPADPFHSLPDVPGEHGPPTSPGPYPLRYPVHPPVATYSYYSSGSVRRHKARHKRHHTMNPQPTAPGFPIGGGLYIGATQAQLAQPMSAASMTTASISPQNQWFPYRSPSFPPSTASAIHLPSASQTQFPGYPYGQQYPSPSVSSSSQSPYRANNVYSRPPYSSSSVQSLPIPTPPGSAVPSVQNPNQPVVVPLNGGGFVILPPGQQVQVISAKDYRDTERNHDTDSDFSTPSFFGSLGLGRKKTKASSRNGSRR